MYIYVHVCVLSRVQLRLDIYIYILGISMKSLSYYELQSIVQTKSVSTALYWHIHKLLQNMK